MLKTFPLDDAEFFPQLQTYLLWLQAEVVKHAQALNIPMEPNPTHADENTTNSSGGQGDDKTAGWGNGVWP